jgi:predicted RecA/RadA family phage recombinase
MEQGNDYMYRTSDAGQSWHLLAQGHIQGLNTNGLRDNVPAVVGSNASGSVVWFSDITGVIVTSANSGQTWHYRYEGRLLAPQWTSQGFDTVGNSVFEASPYGGVLHSTNGLTWSYIGKVRQAP